MVNGILIFEDGTAQAIGDFSAKTMLPLLESVAENLRKIAQEERDREKKALLQSLSEEEIQELLKNRE